jgi:hypothetical protein
LQNRLIQTSQTGGQQYSDTSPFSIPWLSSYVTSHCLAVVPQSGVKENFYCTVYYITLYSNCEAQWAYQNFKEKIVEDRIRSQN